MRLYCSFFSLLLLLAFPCSAQLGIKVDDAINFFGHPKLTGIINDWPLLRLRYEQKGYAVEFIHDKGIVNAVTYERLDGAKLADNEIINLLERTSKVDGWERIPESWKLYMTKDNKFSGLMESDKKLIVASFDYLLHYQHGRLIFYSTVKGPFKVQQVFPNGMLIKASKEEMVFLDGRPPSDAYDGMKYDELELYSAGTFSYTSVLGSQRTIRRCFVDFDDALKYADTVKK